MPRTAIEALLQRPIAYHPVIAKAFGSVKLAILWGQLYYWKDKGSDPEGWIYKAQKEWEDETGLSRDEQETARKLGRELGVMEEKDTGRMPRTISYRVNIEKSIEVVERHLATMETPTLFGKTDPFEDFYREYPKKKAKESARRAWNRLKATQGLVERIMGDIKKRKESEEWKKQKGAFVPYPATYLNGKRWEDQDEVETSDVTPGKYEKLSQ